MTDQVLEFLVIFGSLLLLLASGVYVGIALIISAGIGLLLFAWVGYPGPRDLKNAHKQRGRGVHRPVTAVVLNCARCFVAPSPSYRPQNAKNSDFAVFSVT